MSDENNSLPAGGEALPAAASAPKSDAEAALQQPAPIEPTAEQKAAADKAQAEKQEGERRKNRTKEYIDRLNTENRELRQYRAEQEARAQQQAPRQPQQPSQQQVDNGPTLQDFNYDLTAFQHARDQWVIEQAEKRWTASQQKQASTAREQATWQTYESRAAEFADANPDFLEVVSSIRYPLTDAAQAAIASHDNGPAIAYHLGNNNSDALELARTPPHLAGAVVELIAERLGAAPPPQATPAAALAPQPKPLSQAPPPAPTVSGRSATEVPAEKLTDDDWYAKDRERRRKR